MFWLRSVFGVFVPLPGIFFIEAIFFLFHILVGGVFNLRSITMRRSVFGVFAPLHTIDSSYLGNICDGKRKYLFFFVQLDRVPYISSIMVRVILVPAAL